MRINHVGELVFNIEKIAILLKIDLQIPVNAKQNSSRLLGTCLQLDSTLIQMQARKQI